MAAFAGIGIRSILDVPLVKDGRMRAVLFIHEPEPHTWSEIEVAVVEDDDDEAGTRLKLKGPSVMLPASMAVALSMVIHELTTNAAKYGALSVPQGRVEVTWRTRGEIGHKRLALARVELNGPPVTPPTRKGFGSKMIREALARETNADIRVDYLPEGLRFTLSLSIARVESVPRC